MKRPALNSLLALVLCAASASAATVVIPGKAAPAPAPSAPAALPPLALPAAPPPLALPAAPPPPALPAVPPPPALPAAPRGPDAETLVREAAQLEKSDGCEAAYLKYREAGDRLRQIQDHARAAQLSGIVTNKLDKLQSCFSSCQPNARQKELFTTAREAAEAEPHRATRILKHLLVGRSVDRCTFWSDARALLRTLPGQSEALDQDLADPCTLSSDLSRALNDAREAVRKERSAVADLNHERGTLPGKLADLADLYRTMDQTRMLLVDLREGLIECDSLSRQLARDSRTLKESIALAQDLIVGTTRDQLAALGKKVRAAQSQLAQKDELLTTQIGEQERLKKELEGLSGLSEELYNDLFALAQAESVSFSVEVEGRRIDQPIEEVRGLIASEKKVLETLAARYPEFFKDGVNREGLKRKKLVLEKLAQMIKRYGSRPDQRLGYSRAMAELEATLQMMEKTLGVPPAKAEAVTAAEPEKEPTGVLPWFLGGGSVLAVAGLTFLRIRAANKS
jgi:predicted  nucleic acid-binding Zn-ribbon protein